uniref:Uncharacterized protein n=1 Tax=Sphaerodactylus townsendi TaxID=933632 RepID=A0ACB8FGM5_9SAUR
MLPAGEVLKPAPLELRVQNLYHLVMKVLINHDGHRDCGARMPYIWERRPFQKAGMKEIYFTQLEEARQRIGCQGFSAMGFCSPVRLRELDIDEEQLALCAA